MRLGAMKVKDFDTPDSWARAVKEEGYSAASCPVSIGSCSETVNAYRQAAEKADILISSVGAWSNPLSADETERNLAKEKCKKALALADEMGARCCVNISGGRGGKWDGPDGKNLTEETFEMIVESVREIIDGVKPQKTFYALETMPWMYPDSAESYLRIIKAVDRKAFAVHFDPVNLINSPSRYFTNGAFMGDFIARLGPHIKSCHAKDVLLRDKFTVHLDEVRPGLGSLDYPVFLSKIEELDKDMPVITEHLSTLEEYRLAAE